MKRSIILKIIFYLVLLLFLLPMSYAELIYGTNSLGWSDCFSFSNYFEYDKAMIVRYDHNLCEFAYILEADRRLHGNSNLFSVRNSFQDMGKLPLDSVKECASTIESTGVMSSLLDHTYCIKTNSGKYAKIYVKRIESIGYGEKDYSLYNRVTFDWVYQTDGSNSFLAKPEVKQITNSPQKYIELGKQINLSKYISYFLIAISIIISIVIFTFLFKIIKKRKLKNLVKSPGEYLVKEDITPNISNAIS